MNNYRIKNYFRYIFMSISIALFVSGCNEHQDSNNKADKMNIMNLAISDTTRQSIQKIKDRRILFAHHSVGENLIDGIKEIAKESGIDLKIDHISVAPLTNKNKFVDFSPGKNTQPKTKVDGFVNKIEQLDAEYIPDVAFMKFCFIDFLKDTDTNEVFSYYKKNILMLKKKRPDITFVHFTAPLMARSYDLKARIKRLLGKGHWIDITNVKRAKFNALLLETFHNDPIFDIATIESTHMDGGRVEFSYGGNIYYSLAPEYTDDGSHLNKLGRRVAASKMAVFLANALSENNKTN